MSAISDNDTETEVVSRNLCGVVDIGSNGIRFSISSKAAHHARIMPCVFKDRVGIPLYDLQYSIENQEQVPIPADIIDEVCAAMKRFRLICEDFGVPETSVRVIGTEAIRNAINVEEFVRAIYRSTGWNVEVLSAEDEVRTGVYGVVSSFNIVSGLYFDLGSGTCKISWIQCSDGEILQSSTPLTLPYGSSSLTRRMKTEDSKKLFFEIKEACHDLLTKIKIPESLISYAEENGGFDLMTRGGGIRSMGHLLLAQTPDYPIQTIVNGLAYPYDEFSGMCDYLFVKGRIPDTQGTKIFKLSDKRAKQLPAVGLLMSAVFDALPKLNTIYFSEGGVREGSLYSILPREVRAEDPLLMASRPYAPLLASRYLALLETAIPDDDIPEIVRSRIAPALCNLAFVHASYPKELQPTAALHVATRGIIAGCHGLSHRARALIGIALCCRWGGNIPDLEEKYMRNLEALVLRHSSKVEAKRIVWWTKYIGTIMYVICGVHPGGNIRENVFDFVVSNRKEEALNISSLTIKNEHENGNENITKHKPREIEVYVRISKDELKTSASVRARIIQLQKKVRKLSKGNFERVKIGVKFYEEY
ncbi:hypothetical protein KAFR_0J02960 [Kazachstania africana CBS 2517]|uniref:Uncharacterized protein n=1 Tax=Kazachstania africana (strain ATCC 22294 / BCRC 22015 / CBS 2517 / CECT 1963 / NBRC 1671 / NRRL Y-8276) TaxID=1071382 RepID=H2B160_KAZAF|nr:hypothetical protein KAFR_0J02960 [Kazachstania africana CBS 2517]CCF60360.1 hypothetical protein KAFR_0J02960 [Kazachstania africana CBS 2517]